MRDQIEMEGGAMAGKGLCGMTLLVAMAAVTACNAGRPTREGKRDGRETASAGNKDVAVCAQVVKTDTGAAIGFRIACTNRRKDWSLLFSVAPETLFVIRLIKTEDYEELTLPLPPPAGDQEDGAVRKDDALNEIPPRTSHVWFIPIPPKAYEYVPGTNDKKVRPIPKGAYVAEIDVRCAYVLLDKVDLSRPTDRIGFRGLDLTLPQMAIFVDPDKLKQDVLETHLKKGNH